MAGGSKAATAAAATTLMQVLPSTSIAMVLAGSTEKAVFMVQAVAVDTAAEVEAQAKAAEQTAAKKAATNLPRPIRPQKDQQQAPARRLFRML